VNGRAGEKYFFGNMNHEIKTRITRSAEQINNFLRKIKEGEEWVIEGLFFSEQIFGHIINCKNY